MAIAKIIEISSSSSTSVEDAVRSGLRKAAETIDDIKGAWISETKVVTDAKGEVTEWRVMLRVTFVVH